MFRGPLSLIENDVKFTGNYNGKDYFDSNTDNPGAHDHSDLHRHTELMK